MTPEIAAAFASFAVLVVTWFVAPARMDVSESALESGQAAD
jgi:hypothetical protein